MLNGGGEYSSYPFRIWCLLHRRRSLVFGREGTYGHLTWYLLICVWSACLRLPIPHAIAIVLGGAVDACRDGGPHIRTAHACLASSVWRRPQTPSKTESCRFDAHRPRRQVGNCARHAHTIVLKCTFGIQNISFGANDQQHHPRRTRCERRCAVSGGGGEQLVLGGHRFLSKANAQRQHRCKTARTLLHTCCQVADTVFLEKDCICYLTACQVADTVS